MMAYISFAGPYGPVIRAQAAGLLPPYLCEGAPETMRTEERVEV